jgi:hypothetical protein
VDDRDANVLWIVVFFLAALFVVAWIPLALAHSFYDTSCCADQDCHPVACEQISAVAGGFQYREARATYFFTRDKMKPSQDENCHVCIHHANQDWSGNERGAATCVYLPVRM